jgi:DNA-binding transcriptional MerR regulator
MAEQIYSIGEAARAAGVTVKAIRYYEEIGLIPHAKRRVNGGQGAAHRLFTATDVGRLRFIRNARVLGLGLRDVRALVAIAEEEGCPGDRTEYRQVLGHHLATVNERIERLGRLRDTLENLMTRKRSPASGTCCWERCGCMAATEQGSQTDRSGSRSSGPRSKKGGRHV